MSSRFTPIVAAALLLGASALVACADGGDNPSGTLATQPASNSNSQSNGVPGGNTNGSTSTKGSSSSSGSSSQQGSQSSPPDNGSGGGGASNPDGGSGSQNGGGGTSGPTWSAVYSSYFAAGSLGNCAASGCHASAQSGFTCGTSASACYDGLVSAGLLNPQNPTGSALIDSQSSPLSWFGGDMPPSGDMDLTAAEDIIAWVQNGAKKN